MLATFGHPHVTDVIMSGGEKTSVAMDMKRSLDREDNSNHSNMMANGRPGSANTDRRSTSPDREADERRASLCSSPGGEEAFPANNNTSLHDKVSSMWKEKYGDSTTSDPAGSVDSALDMDDDDHDESPMELTTNGHHHGLDSEEGVNRSSPTGKFCRANGGSGLPGDDLQGSGLSRHHLGSLMRGDMVSCETSKLLRGILQGKGKGLSDPSDLGLVVEGGMHTPDSGLISQLLQRDHNGRALMRDTSYDGEMDSVHSPNPGDISSDDMSDQENQGTHGNALNGTDLDRQRSKDDASSTGSMGEGMEAKRARIENIIGTMRVSPNRAGDSSVEKRHKRKQFVPQQHDVAGSEGDEPAPKVRKTEREVLRKQLRQMQQQLAQMQDRYVQLFDGETADQADLAELSELNLCRRPVESSLVDPQGKDSSSSRPTIHATSNIIHSIERLVGSSDDKKDKRSLGEGHDLDPSVFIRQAEKLVKEQEMAASSKKSLPASAEGAAVLTDLAKVLKEEISHSVGSLVDTIVARFARVQHQHKNKIIDSKTNRYLSDAVKEIQKMAKSSPTPPSNHQSQQHQHSSSEDRHLKEQQHQQQQQQQHHQQQQQLQQQQQQQQLQRMSPVVIKPTRTKVTDKILHPMLEAQVKMFGDMRDMRDMRDMPRPHLFPPPPYYPGGMPHLPHLYGLVPPPAKEPEQTEPMALVVNTPKKKRTKVTDTRLSPRAAKALLQEGIPPHALQDGDRYPPEKLGGHHPHHHPLASPHHHPHMHPMSPEAVSAAYHASFVPVSLPTSVAIPNPSLQHSDVLAMYSNGEHSFAENSRSSSHSPAMGDHGSPNMAHTPSEGLGLSPMIKGEGDSMYDHHSFTDSPINYDGSSMQPQTVTLTPMHLRKAKLMFFFLRYPSSAILKIYFPDVKFNKNNTAQLVKWFSNFREFCYIQMEKYARQALAEGVTNPEDITVTSESEIYRVLNLHYNRNNQIEVPDNFRLVVQATLREFFKSIQAGKDQEQSWKKAIYKIIARMDGALPEFFRSPNWMEQLTDM